MKPFLDPSARARTALLLLGILALAAAALPFAIDRLIPPVRLFAGIPGSYYLLGFYDPETAPDGTSFQWTSGHATVNFPYTANLGRYATVVIRAEAARAPGQEPARLTVSLNGRPSDPITLGDRFAEYSFYFDSEQTPNPYLHPTHLQVDLASTTASSPQDSRKLGVATDWIRIEPRRGTRELASLGVLCAVLTAALFWIAAARFSVRWALGLAMANLATLVIVQANYLPRAMSLFTELALAGAAWLIAAAVAPRAAPPLVLGLAALGLWLVFAGHVLGDWQMDDAYISYRYASNLAGGQGLVYNPGEVVEGYTNFLWTLLAAGVLALGKHPAGPALGATIFCGQLMLALSFVLGRRLSPEREWSGWNLLAPGLLAVDISFLTYAARGSGMESALFALLVLGAIALLWHSRPRPAWGRVSQVLAGLLLAFATLTRPEGLLVAALLITLKTWQERRDGPGALVRLAAVLLPYLAVVVPYEAWRITFYGYLFPNTFYDKTGSSLAVLLRGAEYAWEFVLDHSLIVLAPALVACMILARRITVGQRPAGKSGSPNPGESPGTAGRLVVALGLLVVVYTGYIVVVGGDHFPGERFFVPLVPALAVLAQAALVWLMDRFDAGQRAPGGARRWVQVAIAAILLAYCVYSLWLERPEGSTADRTRTESYSVDAWGSAGLWLRDNTPASATTAAQGAGAIAYYSERKVVDMLGLNDLHIAHLSVLTIGEKKAGHDKRDPAYVLSRQPDYVLAIWEDYFDSVRASLDRDYAHITVRGPMGENITWLKRKDASHTGGR